MKLLQTLSRQLSDKTYSELSMTGKAKWRLFDGLSFLVLLWKRLWVAGIF